MPKLIAALGHRWGRLERPEHGDTQGDRHKGCEGDVEVLAHEAGVKGALGKGKRLEETLKARETAVGIELLR